MNIERIAKVAHEANKAYCDSIGDYSQSHWDDADDWQKQITFDGISARVKNLNMPDHWQHEVWMTQMLASGWIYSEVRDADKKTHPCLVAYEELPDIEKAKDALFTAVAKSLSPFLTVNSNVV